MKTKIRLRHTALVFFLVSSLGSFVPARAAESVRIWEESLVVPTYLIEAPDPNPVFYFGRAYQGAQGPVYPYPFLDRLTDRKVDKSYRAVYLENEFLKICVLPELGGRIFSAVDKTNGYDFVYRQRVIKPALIGMLGAWISGGVEWNIPHHHRATTFMEVDRLLERRPDGSATVWVGEIELRDRMKWIVGLTLRPGRSSIEVATRIINRTPLAHSMLAFANVAVHVNPDYQVIFPPDVELATFHAKNQFSRWPVSTEIFNGQDYTKGVDASWWKSHAYPTSFFAWEAKGDFLAGYDHGKEAGIVFVGDPHFVPGKKLWTWGTGSDGRLWERILTDADGPYAELMVGAYSDNQPDYSWISPYEIRSVTQEWYPVRGIGGVKAANGEAAIDVSVQDGGRARVGLYSTTERPAVRAVLRAGGRTIFDDAGPASPRTPFVRTASLPAGVREADLSVDFLDADGTPIISYSPPKRTTPPLPPPYAPPAPPKDIDTIEGLYLAGLRIEQFRSAAFEPEPYYEEALRRDPGDYRSNAALGLLHIKRARYADAEARLRRAAERAEGNYTRPKDGEALYYLGLALRAQGKKEEAEDAFNRAAWTLAWRSAAFTQLAELAAADGAAGRALSRAAEALITNTRNNQALGLRASLLRRLGRTDEARSAVAEMRSVDPADLRAAFEVYLLSNSGGLHEDVGRLHGEMLGLLRDSPAGLLELAADYGRGGMWDDAASALGVLTAGKKKGPGDFPLLHYFQAYARERAGDRRGAAADLKNAATLPPDYGFPFQSEFIDILRWAMAANPGDARAPYYLGNFFFDRQPEEAMRLWSVSAGLEPRFATVLRNLGIGAWKARKNLSDARAWLEKAAAADPSDPRLLLELDQVSELSRVPAEKRLAVLEKSHAVAALRDDVLGREVQLLVLLGRHEKAIELLKSHHFRVWEGGGNIHASFVQAYLARGRAAMDARRFKEALAAFETALTYPPNLETAEPRRGAGSVRIFFHVAAAREALGDRAASEEALRKALSFRSARAEDEYYRGLCLAGLGRAEEAAGVFDGLIRAGSVTSPGAEGFFRHGLGLLGKGRGSEAAASFEKAAELDPYDPEIRHFRQMRLSPR